ncbi:MAG: FG-GAP repeat protein [Nitrosomonas sp.]|nr:FG-GAP repeat protein [Nitrosomonas sp.]
MINGLATADALGKSVSSAGDINNDGFDDLIIRAPFGDGVVFNSGVGYVLFGRSTTAITASTEFVQDIASRVGINQTIELI